MEVELKVPILTPEFVWDKNVEPEKVQFNIFDNAGERILGIKLPLKEYRKFVKLVNRFDGAFEEEVKKASGRMMSHESGIEITV